MEETLAKVARIALRGKDHAHVVATSVSGQLVNIAHRTGILTLPQDGKHGLQPITLNQDVIVEEAEKFASPLASAQIVVVAKFLRSSLKKTR